MGRGGIIQNKCSVEEMVEEGTGRGSDVSELSQAQVDR
jgi:hypothetical protein